MKLIPITTQDFPLWSQFRSEIYPLIDAEYDLKEIAQIFQSELWHCWFIAHDDGTRIGLVEISLRNIVDGCLSSPVPYLEGLYLAAPLRGKGYGTKVIEMIKSWCLEHGYSELATDAEITNTDAQQFYKKLGFEIVDRVVEFRLALDKK